MEEKIPTESEIIRTISVARDSVWVITDEISKEPISKNNVQTVQRNVAHLELVMSNGHITSFGEDLSDISNAISTGNTFVEEYKGLLIENNEME